MQGYRANGRQIVILREILELTQEQLSAKVGYSVKTIWKAEASHILRRRTLEDIAVALNAELKDVVDPSDSAWTQRTALVAARWGT